MRARIDRRLLLPIFLLGFLTHAETIDFWFVASDTLPLIETSRVGTPGEVIELFTQPLMADSAFLTTALFYRPVASLTYAVNYALWGLVPFGYHLTNVVLHGIATVLVAVAVTDVTDRPAVGLLTAVLFAIHPVTLEVVPVTARRQDVLLTVFVLGAISSFVRWYRRWERNQPQNERRRLQPHRPLAVALVAYALALGSKETALLVPVLVLAWVVLQQGLDRPRRTLRTAVGAVGPFAAVTLLYVAVRVAVLGGLGGYRTKLIELPPYTPKNVLLSAGKYVLWAVHPTNVIESETGTALAGSLMVSGWFLAVVLGGTGLVALARRGYFSSARYRILRAAASIGCVVSFAAIPYVISAGPGLADPVGSPALVGIVTGTLFVGGCAGGILTAVLAGNPLAAATRRQFLFFGCWFVVPFGMLLVSRYVLTQPLSFGFGMRNAYYATVPVLASLSMLLLRAVRRVRRRIRETSTRRWLDADVALIAVILVLLVPLVAISPLFHSHQGWESASDLNRKSLHGLSAELEDTPDANVIYLVNFPNGFDAENVSSPHARSVTPLRPYSIEAWLALQKTPRDIEVSWVRRRTVEAVPNQLSFRTREQDDSIVVRVETNGTAESRA